MKRGLAYLILLLEATGGVVAARALPLPHSAGIVVESIRQGSTGDKAGILPGDILLDWSRAPSPPANRRGASGVLATPFDLAEVFVEQLPRGRVTLTGRRGTETRCWVLSRGAPSAWQELETAPVLPEPLQLLHQRGRAAAADGRLDDAVAAWSSASDLALADGGRILALWLRVQAARALTKAHEWTTADRLYREILAERKSPAPTFVTLQLLREQGKVFQERREWQRAEESYQRARSVARRLGHHELGEAASLAGLGAVAGMSRGSKDPALYYHRALALRRRWAPGSSDVAETWQDWAISISYHNDYTQARKLERRAVALQRQIAAPALYLADRQSFLGFLENVCGDRERALPLWHQALDLLRTEAPRDLLVVSIQQGLANAAADQGDFAAAAAQLRQPFALLREIAPDGFPEAGFAFDLGTFERGAGQWQESATHLCRAVDIIEDQRRKYRGNEETLTRWGTMFAPYYRECAGALVKIGQTGRAFDVLEQGRARAFLHRFKERDLRASPLPSARESRRRQLDAEFDRIERSLDLPGGPTGLQRAFAEGRLREIRRQREQLLADSLPFESVVYPEPLTWQQARAALDPGTVLVSYAVGEDETQLFVLSAPGSAAPPLEVVRIPIGAAELKRRVLALRGQRSNGRRAARDAAAESRALYALLLEPVEPLLATGQRILIAPDGPLHFLYFGALRRSQGFLIEWKPIHYALSATMYAEIRKSRPALRAPAEETLVAFGDPDYPALGRSAVRGLADPALRSAAKSGLARLPATRFEVEELARLFPKARIFVGKAATKSRVRKASRGARILHLAVHGLLNEAAPLRSALALTFDRSSPRAAHDGFLQAWEIMDTLPLDADLVVLSACDTALGPEIGGEGLIGLTRAFHYAGARSVVATLWGVSDRSTAALMIAFYRNLRSGLPKDRALQAAQIELIHSQQWSSPFHWAAFQLSGDWQ